MKIRSNVYKEIRDRLLDKLPFLQYIDLQKWQFNNKAQNYPVPLPACLVEFKQVQWSQTTGGQLGDCTLSLYIYIDHVTDSFDGAEQETETINLLDYLDQLYECMQGFSGEKFAPLNRISDTIASYESRYVCYRIDFQTTLFHDDAPQKTGKIDEVNFKFKKS
jgi:hypothetical protein